MTTYICKCGKTFEKNTGAGTTGFRMPDYGPGHGCYGCPFVQTETWKDPFTNKLSDIAACRGSKALDYQTDAYCCNSKGAALHVRTLDLEFIQAFFKEYLALPGHTYEQLFHGMDSPENGRQQYSFGFAANKQGDADRKALIDRYFRSEGERPGELPCGSDRLVRSDVTPEQEKEIVLNQIEKAKEEAQSMNSYYAPCGHKFSRFSGGTPEISVEVTGCTAGCFSCPNGLHEPETDDHGPRVMCVCSRKKVDPADTPIALEDADAGYPEGAEEMNELAGQADLVPDAAPAEQEDDAPESGNEGADSADAVDEMPNSEDDTSDPADDQPEEQHPCDWKNASGGDDEDEGPEDPEQSLPDGPDLSLRLPAFDAIFNAADDALRDMARTLKTKFIESGELDLKIVIDNMGGILRPNSKSSKGYCQLKPAKVTFPIRFSDDAEFIVDAQGRVILPEDREHQVSFDEVQPGQRDIPPTGGTATVDGTTGIIEHYEADGPEDPPADESQKQEDAGDDVAPMESEPEEKLYPCKNYDCPFYGVPDDGTAGCCYDLRKDDAAKDAAVAKDIEDAILFNNCCRDEVITAYAAAHPDEDEPLDQPADHDGADDFPPFEDDESNKDLEDDAS